MKLKNILSHVLPVLLGCAIGVLGCLLLSDTPPVRQEKHPTSDAPARPSAVTSAPNAVERALRKRLRQVEAELAAARAALPASTNAPAASEVRPVASPRDFRMPNPREMLENLKKNDPKKYEQIRKRFAEHRKMQLQRTQGRLDFLSSIDTSHMSAKEKANHEKLQELLAQRENMSMPDPEESTEEEMRAAMNERRELDRAIRKANATERETLLGQTATALGLEGEDAQTLTDAIKEVIEATGGDRGGPQGGPQGGEPPPPPADGNGGGPQP